MRAFARNASSRDEEDPESPTASVSGPNTPVDYSGTTTSGLNDEQMQKLKEFVDPRGIRTPSPRREREHTGSRAGTPCFPQTDAKRVKTPAPPLRLV